MAFSGIIKLKNSNNLYQNVLNFDTGYCLYQAIVTNIQSMLLPDQERISLACHFQLLK